VREYQANESNIKSQYQEYTGKKAGLNDTQIEQIGKLYRYYSDKVFMSIDSYKDLKIRSGFAFMSYVCNISLPKGIDYSSSEDFCKTNAKDYFDQVKARQMRLIRLAELAGHKEKKASAEKEQLTPLERIQKMVLGDKSKWSDIDRKALFNSLAAYFKKIAAKSKGNDKGKKQKEQVELSKAA
jgi:hypothetical protein